MSNNLSNIISITISANTRTPSQVGFGTPLICGYHTRYPARVKEYADLDALVEDGFSTTPGAVGYAIYKAAQVICSQNPRPPSFKVGRRASAPSQVLELTPTATAAGTEYAFTIGGHDIAYTVAGTMTLAQIATAIQGLTTTALGAAATVTTTGTPANTVHIATTDAGALLEVTGKSPNLTFHNATTDPGLAADLAAIALADDDWYGLCLDSNSAAEITVAAAWVEAQLFKIGAFDTSDTACGDVGSTTDVMATEKALSHAKSIILYNDASLLSFTGAGLLAEELAYPIPGKRTWAYKTLRSVPVGNPSTTQQSAIQGKNGNVYVMLKGIGVTLFGKSPDGDYLDLTTGVHWFHARLQERVFGMYVNAGKIPMTSTGITQHESCIRAQMAEATSPDGLSLLASDTKDTPQTVTMPTLASLSTADKANRNLTGCKFSAYFAGAIHKTQMAGTFSV
jgi:hypothetical protein